MIESLFIASAVHSMNKANQAQMESEKATRLASDVRLQSDAIAADVDKLFLIAKALWTILKEEHGYTDDGLLQKIKEIDLEDGKLDGKISKAEKPSCPKCGRKVIGRHPVCLYCGTTIVRNLFER
jgi:ribosomal protein S27AE